MAGNRPQRSGQFDSSPPLNRPSHPWGLVWDEGERTLQPGADRGAGRGRPEAGRGQTRGRQGAGRGDRPGADWGQAEGSPEAARR